VSIAAGFWSRALDFVFPPRCVACRSFGSFLCEACLASTPRADGLRCYRCWQPGRADYCLSCYAHPPSFRGLRSAFVYSGASRAAVHALKFDGVSALVPAMAAPMVEILEHWSPQVDVIVPVPLGGMRKRVRGYNQAELLAREISRGTGLAVDTGLLRRARSTPPQARQADARARRRNIAGAFEADRRATHRNVLLVDDVVTTGATMDACSRTLLDAGAKAVFCLTFTREH